MRPDRLVAALDDDVHSCWMPLSSRASRTSSGRSGSSWRRTTWAERQRGRREDDVCQAERVVPTRLRTVFRSVDPATAKQTADEFGGDLRVALAGVDLVQTEPRSLRGCR